MKARDIIPGWPRGRSSVALWPDWENYEWYAVARGPFGWHKSAEKLEDLRLDAEYHAAQRRMVHRYFAQYRRMLLVEDLEK